MDALYLGEVTHVAVNLSGEDALTEKDLVKFCFQVECLYQNDEISYQTLKKLLKDGIGCFSSSRRVLNSPAQTALRQSASVHGQITRDVLQAVGRIGRTFLKRPVVYLFTTEKTLGDLDPECLENRLLSPEMQALSRTRFELRKRAEQVDAVRNEAERKATRGKSYIMRMLGVSWNRESMALWKGLRETVLRCPRADGGLLERDPVVRTYYIPLPEGQDGYLFAQKGDFSEVLLCLDGNRAVFAERLRASGLSPSRVSEAAGSFILRQELGLHLREIEDPSRFEAFDFQLGEDVYFDFKHWKAGMRMEEAAMRAKTLEKLESVGGRRAFIVNLISDGISEPSSAGNGRLIEIPGLLLPDGRVNRDALAYMGRCLHD